MGAHSPVLHRRDDTFTELLQGYFKYFSFAAWAAKSSAPAAMHRLDEVAHYRKACRPSICCSFGRARRRDRRYKPPAPPGRWSGRSHHAAATASTAVQAGGRPSSAPSDVLLFTTHAFVDSANPDSGTGGVYEQLIGRPNLDSQRQLCRLWASDTPPWLIVAAACGGRQRCAPGDRAGGGCPGERSPRPRRARSDTTTAAAYRANRITVLQVHARAALSLAGQ